MPIVKGSLILAVSSTRCGAVLARSASHFEVSENSSVDSIKPNHNLHLHRSSQEGRHTNARRLTRINSNSPSFLPRELLAQRSATVTDGPRKSTKLDAAVLSIFSC